MSVLPTRWMAAALAALLALTACNGGESSPDRSQPPVLSQSAAPSRPEPDQAPLPGEQESPPQPAGPSYIEQLARQVIPAFAQPGMSEFERVKAAFDYIIESCTLDDPIGLELWRVRGEDRPQPSFVENRSLSVLLHGVGMCEDYAAALAVLLRGMGLEAEYQPGLTYAADGSGWVNHAWTVVQIDGVWYHLDSQLEQNVTRRDTVNYRYFLKSDAAFGASHLWGQRLIDSGLLTPAQNQEIAEGFLHPPCPQDYPTPPPHSFTPAPKPDIGRLKAAAQAEVEEFERLHGPLEPLELNIIPPVFGLEGYPVGG